MPRPYNVLADARRVYREPIPSEVPYYKVDPDDPAIFTPCYKACKLRSNAFVKLPCGAFDIRFYCTHFQKYVEGQNCEDCNDASP